MYLEFNTKMILAKVSSNLRSYLLCVCIN